MIEIKFEIDKQRSIAVDDNNIIGVCEFLVKEDTWDIIHTVVDNNYQGQGIAKKLVLEVVEQAKNNNVMLIGTCSYAAKILKNL